MPVLDEEKDKKELNPAEKRYGQGSKPDGSHDDVDLSQEEKDEFEKLRSGLEGSENSQGNPSSQETTEQQQLEERDGPWENKTGKRGSGRRVRLTKKQGGIAGILATFAVVSGVLGFIQSGNFIINNLREVLLGNISELQISHEFRYRRRYIHKLSDMWTRDGIRGSKLLNDMELRGYKPRFNADGALVGLELPGRRAGIPSYAIEDHINEYMELRHPLRSSRWKTKRMEAFYRHYKIPRRSVVALAQGAVDDPDVTVNKAIAGEVLDDGNEPRLAAEGESTEGRTEDEAADIEAENEANKTIVESDGSLDDIKRELREGKKLDELSPENRAILSLAGDNIDQELIDLIENIDIDNPKLGTRVIDGIKSFGLTSEPIDKACTLKRRTKAAIIAGRLYRARSLIRYASVFIRASDQTRTGSVDPKLMSSLMERVTAKDQNGNPIGASPGFSYALKKRFSKTKNEGFGGSIDVAGKERGIAGGIMDVFRQPGLAQVSGEGTCDVVQNVFFQIGEGAGTIALTVFTGGGAKAGTEAGKQSARVALKEGFKTFFRNVFSKQGAKQLAKVAAFELSFEGALKFIQIYTEKSLGLNYSGQETGAELGNILVAGAGTLNKQRGLQSGMVPSTTAEYVKSNNEYIAWKKERQKEQSFFARTFDINNSDSLAFNVASNIAYNVDGSSNPIINTTNHASKSIASIVQNPATIFSSSINALTTSVGAQSEDEIAFETYTSDKLNYELATDPAGNILPIMRDDIANIDPEENEESLIASGDIDPETKEPASDEFKEHFANCVENVDTISILEEEDSSDARFDCRAELPKTKKFKAQLAYLNMKDGVDSALFPEQIVSSGDNATSGSGASGAPSAEKVDPAILGTNSDNVACAPGTTDLGVVQSRYTGEYKKTPGPMSIRLCQIDDIPGRGNDTNGNSTNGGAVVEANVSGAWAALARQAKEDGIQLEANSSFRLADSCGGTGDGKRCARPGKSAHQTGWAIDFKNMSRTGSSTTSCSGRARLPSSPQWTWMLNNAERYGIKQYTYEAWHWDPMPLENRCGTNQ